MRLFFFAVDQLVVYKDYNYSSWSIPTIDPMIPTAGEDALRLGVPSACGELSDLISADWHPTRHTKLCCRKWQKTLEYLKRMSQKRMWLQFLHRTKSGRFRVSRLGHLVVDG